MIDININIKVNLTSLNIYKTLTEQNVFPFYKIIWTFILKILQKLDWFTFMNSDYSEVNTTIVQHIKQFIPGDYKVLVPNKITKKHKNSEK